MYYSSRAQRGWRASQKATGGPQMVCLNWRRGNIPLMIYPDRFLPFSLLHFRKDQFHFSGDPPIMPVPAHISYVTGGAPLGEPSARAGYHDQAVFDAAFRRIAPSPPARPAGENMNPHDCRPDYDMNLVLNLLQTCLRNNEPAFWAKISDEHHIKSLVTDMDALCTEFIRHLFYGACVSCQGSQCRAVVTGERLPESMGIRVLDSTLRWVEQGELTIDDLARVCRSINIQPSAKNKKRSLLTKLTERRRLLLDVVDVAALALPELLCRLGSGSSLKVVKSVAAAHGIDASEVTTKDDGTRRVFEHITRGECANSIKNAAGCEQLARDARPRQTNAIHLQVAVLWSIIENASKQQLHKIFDLHDIDYEPTDKKKTLKTRLRRYIQSLEKGKLKDAEAESDAIGRLQKLDDIRKNWPKLVPMALKEKIVKDFRAVTSSASLASFTCACCARELQLSERIRKDHTDVNLDLLNGPDVHWNNADFAPPPPPFLAGPLKGKLVDPHGVVIDDGERITLELCGSCSRGLRRGCLPKHALANRMYLGQVPEPLRDLTMVEESMIARARAKSWIVKLQEQDSDSASPTSQRGLRGHTIIFPQQPDRLASILPPPVGETLTFICVIFVGSSNLTKEWLREKAKPLVVRREKVRSALSWLKQNNPLYRDVEIDDANLDALPLDDVLPYHVERVANDDAQQALVSRYDNVADQPGPGPGKTDATAASGKDNPSNSPTHFDSVVVADVDAHTPMNQLRAAAVCHAKTKNKPFVQVAHGPKPVNEFFNVDLFPTLYPTLFPYGCGGFEDRKRFKRISLKEHVKWLFSLRDRRFQTHYSFLFTVFNILQRRALLLGASLKVKRASFTHFAKSFSSVSSDAIGQVLARLENGEGATAHTEEERKVLKLMKEVNLVTAKVPGSSAARVAMRNEIRALTMTHGMPSFYVTINPADAHNPVVKFLAGADIDIDKMLLDQVPNYWEQAILISSNPAVGAKFFNTYLKAFLRAVLGCMDEDLNVDGGILGTVKAHYGCVEAQGRGSLHCHMLIWIEGALNPNEIRDKVMNDAEWGKRLLDYLDDTITNIVPNDPLPDAKSPWDGKDPCTLRGVDLDIGDVQERLALRARDVSNLAERVQRHRHSHTCYKYYKAGDARTCRFDLKEENFRAESHIDTDNGQISLRCLDGLVNNFNTTMLEAVRCNMDIQFIGSGESAKAMIYYITDYITKSQLKSHVAYAALQLAVKKCEEMDDADDDFTARSKRLLQKCAYAMVSHQEMSAQQVASYLMGYEDHFTSHRFNCLYWASFERYIERYDELKVCFGAVKGCDELDDHEQDLDLGDHGERGQPADDGENDGDDSWPVVEDDEEVSVRVESDGNVSILADQITDYTLRPRELGEMCLWDFVAKTEKVYRRRCGVDAGEDLDMILDEQLDDDDGDGDEEEKHLHPRREAHVGGLYEFLPDHKERDRKCVRLRVHEAIPVPIGPALPRRDEIEAEPRYCRLMMILFKPWRSFSDLRGSLDSWQAAFKNFSPELCVEHLHVVENMQVLHECRDSRNEHMQARVRDRSKRGAGRSAGEAGQDNDQEIDMSEVLNHLEDIDRMASRRLDESNHETQECLARLADAGYFTVSDHPMLSSDADNSVELTGEEDDAMEDQWQDVYDKRKAAWRLEAQEVEHGSGPTEPITINELSMEDLPIVGIPLVNERDGAMDNAVNVMDGKLLIDDVVKRWTLNSEQERAFRIVAEHTMQNKPQQLLMYLGGPGGTGKSRVVNALREFFKLRNECRRFRLAAYTGVAARNIGGATLHALLQMYQSGREPSAKTKKDLAAMWEGIDYLFVDELSMIGCEMLHDVSRALSVAKGSTAAFGGVNMIFAGDFAQLPPIGDTRLYKDINTSSVGAAVNNRAQGKVLGRLLWLSVETVVILHETMRQSGSGNAGFVDLLHRLRDGFCDEGDYEVLASRSLGRLSQRDKCGDWKFVPVIVTSNATRDAINCEAAQAFAEQVGKPLHWYHAIDTHKRATVTDPDLIKKLESQHSGQTKHRLRRIPLVIGMPVAINQNFDVAAGVVNGSYGFLRGIRYFTDRDGRRYLKSCIVEIPGSDTVEMPGLQMHHFPVLPDVTDLKFEHGGSRKRCTIKRKQVPIEPGFAMTVHKAQGQTMSKVIVDLAGCAGTEPPYVMVSRATSLDGLLVLRDFNARQITKRRSEDLRKEFERLMYLKWKTIASCGLADEVEVSKRMMEKLREPRESRVIKRKASRVHVGSGGSKRLKV